MRLVLISPEYPPADHMGGIGTNTAVVAPALARRGHSVAVVTKGAGERYVDREVTVMRLDQRWVPNRAAEHLLALRQIAAAARGFEPDVVQAAEWEASAWWLARFGRTPVVTRLATPSYIVGELDRHTLDQRARLIRRLERDQARRSSAVFGPTRAIVEQVARDWKLDERRLEVVPNPVELEVIRDAGAGEPPLELPARFLVFFGRMERRKGIEVLAQALPRVLAAAEDVDAIFIGRDPGDERGELMERFRRYVTPVEERVHMLGELPRASALAIVARAEVAVFPSLWESFGYVAVEAMALGRAVVASRAGGFPEFIEHERTGWLVPPGDVDALAQTLIARLADPDGSRRVGEAARQGAERFDVNTIVEELEQLFERVHRGFDESLYRKGYRRFFRAEDRDDPFHRLYEAKRDAVLAELANQQRLRVLDVGGGYGRLAASLAVDHDVTLVDISSEMLEEARSRCPPTVELVLADARRLPFGDDEFDAVLALDLFPHLPDVSEGLRELRRVVRPNGRLVFDTTNAVPLWVLAYPSYFEWRPKRLLLTLLAGGVLPEWRTLVRHHRAGEIRQALNVNDLTLERRQDFGPPLVPKWHLWWTRKR